MPPATTTESPSLSQEIDDALAALPSEETSAPSDEDSTEAEAPEVGQSDEDVADESAAQVDDEPKFTVKVRGESQEVTLDELLKGYQRQSDYTKSKQELATERQEAAEAMNLANALRENPQETLQLLAEHLLGSEDPDDDIDPLEQRLNQHDQFIAQQQEREVLEQVNATLEQLSGLYEGFDGEATLEWALEHKQPNLRAAWLTMQDDAAREADLDARNKVAAARKRSDPPVAGRSTAQGTTSKPARQIKTPADALDAALDDLGVGWDQIEWS